MSFYAESQRTRPGLPSTSEQRHRPETTHPPKPSRPEDEIGFEDTTPVKTVDGNTPAPRSSGRRIAIRSIATNGETLASKTRPGRLSAPAERVSTTPTPEHTSINTRNLVPEYRSTVTEVLRSSMKRVLGNKLDLVIAMQLLHRATLDSPDTLATLQDQVLDRIAIEQQRTQEALASGIEMPYTPAQLEQARTYVSRYDLSTK